MIEMDLDSGLVCLVLLARLHGLPADPSQLQHQYGQSGQSFSHVEIIRAGRSLGLKARLIMSDWSRLKKTALPAIAIHQDGHFFLVMKVAGEEAKILVHDPVSQQPMTLSREAFENSWSGNLILFTRRAGAIGDICRFNFSWFIPAILKYRRLLGEVLLASFFLQIFALISPLFFQVVIDKVLVHRGLTTLDVLVMGLMIVLRIIY